PIIYCPSLHSFPTRRSSDLFNAPLRTRRERAQRLKSDKKDFFEQYGPKARAILEELVEKYADHGSAQFTLPEVLEVPPLNRYGKDRKSTRLNSSHRTISYAV